MQRNLKGAFWNLYRVQWLISFFRFQWYQWWKNSIKTSKERSSTSTSNPSCSIIHFSTVHQFIHYIPVNGKWKKGFWHYISYINSRPVTLNKKSGSVVTLRPLHLSEVCIDSKTNFTRCRKCFHCQKNPIFFLWSSFGNQMWKTTF